MTIESKLLNQFQWSRYHSFQKTMFYLMKSQNVIFSNIKETKIERSAFFLDTRYIRMRRNKYHMYGILTLQKICLIQAGASCLTFIWKPNSFCEFSGSHCWKEFTELSSAMEWSNWSCDTCGTSPAELQDSAKLQFSSSFTIRALLEWNETLLVTPVPCCPVTERHVTVCSPLLKRVLFLCDSVVPELLTPSHVP